MDLINESLIVLDINLHSKESVFEKIADVLDASGRLIDRQKYIEDVIEREIIITTSIGDQIAIPHAISRGVNTASLVYLRLLEPVQWNTSDQAKYIFGIAVPVDNVDNLHLKILSSTARKLLDDTIKLTFFDSNSKKDILAALLE